MTQAQAARTGLTEYQQRLKGWEAGQHEQWERMRWLAWHQYNLSPFLKQKPGTPKELAPFPWEEGAKKKKPGKRAAREKARITDEERTALDAIMKEFYANKYGETPIN